LIKFQAFQSVGNVPVLWSAEVEVVKSESCEEEAGGNCSFQLREENERIVTLSSLSEISIDILCNVSESVGVVLHDLSDINVKTAFVEHLGISKSEVVNSVVNLSNQRC
jgi:hypothetical protein